MWFPNIRKRPWRNIHAIVGALVTIVDSLVTIVTLGYVYTDLTMNYLCWCSLQMIARQRRMGS